MMDALTDVGVYWFQTSGDSFQRTIYEHFASAKASGLVHPKDILVKRLKRAVSMPLIFQIFVMH